MCEWVNDKNKTHCILSHFLSITIYLRVYSTKSTTTLNSNSRWRRIFDKLLFTSTTTENECPIAANLTWLVSEGSLIFHHASTASNYNQSQWSCTRSILAVVSRLTPTLTRVFDMLPPKKKYRKWSFRRWKEKHGCLNVSFPCVCAPPFVLTVILSKARSIYFNDKRLKLMLLQNKICENNLHV